MEFIELYDGGVGSTSLDGLALVLFNGSDDASYKAFDLDGFSTRWKRLFCIEMTSTLKIDDLAQIPLKLYINSPPEAPQILFPRNGEVTTVLAWFNAVDPDAADSPNYSVEVAEISDFATLHCAQNVNRAKL